MNCRRIRTLQASRLYQSAAEDDDDDWLHGGDGSSRSDDEEPTFASRSQMPQFIDNFLEKERDKRGEARPQMFTHMIGVPMADCHQLQIELESVQRAILYHCPSLVHACIVPSMSRMPLLFVDASREPPGRVTMDLQQMVQKVVQKHCFAVKEDFDGDDANYAGVNKDGYKPLTMTFHKLQIDGEDNEVLFTVADKDNAGGLSKVQAMVAELEEFIAERGWKVMWPPSDIQGMPQEGDLTDEFAPRIPLMRLPPNFENVLRPLEDEDDRRTSEDGGNGISPVFWIKWEKDVMGRNVRLREIGIYPRRPGMSDLAEQTFYLPHESVELPGGNEALSRQERVHRDYNEKRMKESERRLTDEDLMEPSADGDFMDPSLSDNRKILESIYGKDSAIFNEGLMQDEQDIMSNDDMATASAPLDDWMQERINDIVGVTDGVEPSTQPNTVEFPVEVPPPQDTDDTTADDNTSPAVDGCMQERIRDIVEKRPSNQRRAIQDQNKEDVPDLDNNPIFQAYRDGTLVGKIKEQLADDPLSNVPPFPSEERLRGFWKVVRSPITSAMDAKDESRSDNFALRVDGTVSGGPMLDQETQQKAGGGTWRMQEAIDETLLRIRLVIPPKRDRIMVWEGEIYKELESRPSSNSASVLDATSFGKVTTELSTRSDELQIEEEVIKCSGKVRFTFMCVRPVSCFLLLLTHAD
jgi:hypothetical protein